MNTKSYPKRKLQRIEIDNEFERESSDQWELFNGEKKDQGVTRKAVGYKSTLSHIFFMLSVINELTLNYEISL